MEFVRYKKLKRLEKLTMILSDKVVIALLFAFIFISPIMVSIWYLTSPISKKINSNITTFKKKDPDDQTHCFFCGNILTKINTHKYKIELGFDKNVYICTLCWVMTDQCGNPYEFNLDKYLTGSTKSLFKLRFASSGRPYIHLPYIQEYVQDETKKDYHMFLLNNMQTEFDNIIREIHNCYPRSHSYNDTFDQLISKDDFIREILIERFGKD